MNGLLDKVKEIAKTAGKLMITEKEVIIGLKDTKENYVTSTDLKIQKYLREQLLDILPGSKFIGEEEDLPNESKDEYSEEDCIWIVDPVDGTANYAHGIPVSVVAIGLVKDGEPVLGVVYQPYLDELFYAERGRGAYLNGNPIHVSDRTKERGILCTAWSCYNKSRAPLCFDITKRIYGVCEDIRRIGTAAYELCLLAKGASEMYFEVNLAPWDYTASICILTEAGGFATSQYGGVRYDRTCMVIGANTKENLDFLEEIVKDEVGNHPESKIIYN